MATAKKKETRDEIIARVSKEYNITPKTASSKGTVIASSKGSPRTYRANRSASEQKQVNQSIGQQYGNQYWAKKKQEGTYNYKWYSGNTPTASETMAQIFRQSSEDEGFFNKLNELFDEETRNSGSVIYSPYREATNYKAIEGLRSLGVDVPETITADWIAGMQHDYAGLKRTTATGHNAAAPTKSSTAEQDIAYWLQELSDAEAKTATAESQLADLYKNVEYYTGLGYSDAEIVKQVRADFSKKYNVLDDMDEARKNYGSVLLNRAVDYNGDDTIYGMIWAARNNGGSGSYFQDAVHQHLGQGNLYKRDPDSEAAHDPSSYESYDPYSRSGTTHDLNMKYGVSSYDAAWLEANRSMLADPDKADDWRDMEVANENYVAATTQLVALDQWLKKQVESGADADAIEDKMKALIDSGDSVWYTNPETGKREQVSLATLKKMEDKRASGTYLNLSGAVPFTLPQYIAKAKDMVAERDAAAQAETEKEAEGGGLQKFKEGFTEGVQNLVGGVGRFLASMGIKGVGSYGEAIDSALEAQEGAYDANTIGKNYASAELGVEIHGDLTAYEQEAINDMVAKVELATQPHATEAQIQEANASVAVVQDLLTQAAGDPSRQEQESYKSSPAWTSVTEGLEEEPREGMVGMTAEPTAFIGEQEAQAQADANDRALEAYKAICQGGEWDGAVVDWAFAHSNDTMAIVSEITEGILAHQQRGAELTGIAKSWWDKFGGLVDNIGGPETYDQMDLVDMGLVDYDSRKAYGTQIYGALQMNEEAYRSKAIEPEVYAQNLFRISGLAEGISGMTGGQRATDEQADQYLEYADSEGVLQKVYDVCNTAMTDKQAELEANQQQVFAANQEVIRQIAAGEPVTDEAAYMNIMVADTSELKANDKAYQDAQAFFEKAIGFDAIAETDIKFTTGNENVDAAWGKDYVMAEGAALYSKGVTALAQAELEQHLKYAAACGMGLEEFYNTFPGFARTPGQIVYNARTEYNGIWGDLGMTIEGLQEANEGIFNAGNEGGKTIEPRLDTLGFSDVLALSVDRTMAENDLNMDKAKHFMLYSWQDEVGKKDLLAESYGFDRTAYAADLEKWAAGREQNLRNVYESSADKIKGMSYEDWRAGNTDKQMDQVKALMETSADIFDIGMSIEELDSQQAIVSKTENAEAIDKLIATNGSEADQKLFGALMSLEQSLQIMIGAALPGGSTLAMTAPAMGGKAYDRFQKSGDWDKVLVASAAEWLASAKIEQMSIDKYIPEELGGSLWHKYGMASDALKKAGAYEIISNPKVLSKFAKALLTKGATGAATLTIDSVGEYVEEFLQSTLGSTVDNIVYGTGQLITADQIAQASSEGVAGFFMGSVFNIGSSMMFGTPKFTDYMGNAISKAEAQLRPEHDGVVLNTAINFEARTMAITNTQEALAQIANSSENVALEEAKKQIADVDAEVAEAEAELQVAVDARTTAVAALEAVDNERADSDVFTEDMQKRMVEAATQIQDADTQISKSRERAEAAKARKEEAQKHHDELKAKVQGMYNQVMDEAKAKFTQMVTDKYFAGDSEAQQAAGKAYLEACQKLQDAQNDLRSAKADAELYKRGTPYGDSAHTAYGEAMLEVDRLAEEVETAKAAMDAAYAETAEGKVEAEMNADLAAAQQAAEEAQAAAEADPMNMRKQLAADHAKAQLDAMQAQQDMEGAKADISERLKSPDSETRDQAVADWKGYQQRASDAVAAAKEAETLFNETDTQKNLRVAIENMRQYSNADLMDENSENYEAANDAYAELQAASADVAIEQAMGELSAAMNAPDKADAIAEVVRRVDEARSQKKVSDNAASSIPQPHIDRRSPMDVTNKDVKPFFNEHREQFKDYILVTAKDLLADVRLSSPGQRIFIQGGAGNGRGSDQEVIGSGRITSTILGEYMDITKWSWKSMETYLEKFIDALENGRPLPNTVYVKRIEMMVDQALSDGYVGIFGEQIPPSLDYLKLKVEAGGMQYKDKAYENEEGFSFYDMHGVGSPITPGLVQKTSDAIRSIAADERVTPNGEYILEIGNKFVYTDGNADNPNISRVITFLHKGVNPDIDTVLREGLYDLEEEGRNQDIKQLRAENLAVISSILGEGDAFRTYDLENAGRSESSAGTGAGSNDRTNGAGSGKQVSPESNIQAWRNTGDGFGDHRGPARTGEVTTADRNPIEILSDLTRRIRVGYNPGGSMNEGNRRLPRAVQGFYSRHARSITTRTNAAGDLEIGLHEFGHAVQQRLPSLHANQQLLNGLSQGVRNAYDPVELDGEAIAEFVVDYIFNRDEAVRQAGAQFVQDFEDMLRQDHTLHDAIMDASHQTELWNNADTGSKIGAITKDGNDPRRGQIGNWLQRTARKIETAVADLTAPADLVSRDFRQHVLYSMHASQRADVSLTRFLIDPQGRNIGQSLAERFYHARVTEGDLAEVSRYALARHALDRRRQGKDVFSEAEFPTAELEAYVADVEANRPNIVAGADALTSFWNDFMDAWWVGTGMIDAADVARMRAMYPNYVPTFRVVGENFNQYGGKSSRFQVRGAVRGGSSLEVIDPIASIVKMTQQMTSTVTQNQLMRDFHNEWRRGGLGEIADDVTQQYRVQRNDTTNMQAALDAIAATGAVDPDLMDDAYAQMLNLQERWIGTGQNYAANVVSGVDEDGNRFFYKIKDENRDLFNLLSGAANRNGDMGAILRTVRDIKNVFTKMTTGSNPLFAIKNAMRDIQASVNTGTHSLTYVDGMYRWTRALYEVLTGSETYREWQAMGGGEHTRFNTELNGQEAGSVVRKLGRELMRGRVTRGGNFKTRNTALENISNVLTWEQLNNAIENASRFVEYRFGRHDLSTEEGRMEAFMRSQDVTTNFGTHGASGTIKVLNQVVPFMNATIQGLNKDVNIIRDVFSGDANRRRQAAPKAAKTLMNTALTAMLQYALLKMFGGSEDDEDYALLNQEMRTGNLIIPIGKGAMQALGDQIGFDKPYIRVPIAQGPLAQGMYAKMLDMVADVANYSPMEVDMWKAAKSILTDSVPDGTVFQAISDARNNRTWYGGEIESEYMRNYSVTNRYDSDTPQAIISLGRMLNVSPAKLDYLLNQYTGFAGKILMPLISGDRLNPDEGWSLSNAGQNLAYSILKNYTIDPASSNDLSSNYSAAKDLISQIIADGKAGKPMGNLAYSADPDEAYSAAEYLSEEFAALDKEIAAMWAEYNAIKDSDLGDGDKARQMRDIRRNYIVPLQQDALALYEEYKMQYIDADSLALEIYGMLPGGLTRPTLN